MGVVSSINTKTVRSHDLQLEQFQNLIQHVVYMQENKLQTQNS